ncbi:hypothetical protein [Paludibaculum fermentans]|uniref:hypothetical protein n=1 Tax=Paludibaculum fermentans TaxID=1473598 RepID=UPI003EBCC4DE
MDTPNIGTSPTAINAAPPPAARLSVRHGRHLLAVLLIDAAGLYCTGGILAIVLGFTASICFSHVRRLGR